MKDRYTKEDLAAARTLSDIVERAKIQVFGTVEQQADLLEQRRQQCSERGYHRVSEEPGSNDDLMICYDCDLWFDKGTAESCGWNYRVESWD